MRVGTLRVQLADDNVITDGWDTKVAVMKASRYGVLEASIYIYMLAVLRQVGETDRDS